MAIERRPRLPDGTLGAVEKLGQGETASERVERLEAENASLTLALIEKDVRIDTIEAIQAEIILQLLGGVPNE
ncbi:hypothetical protein [Lysinibacillus capsici]|uniref:hypothetical protein n=1 Tax=Lysinibacillus capsici TaxID=2115968 RepID=UPI000E2099F5|nr:hypothetical protein [Lysinibacillus capsici]RDV27794.1 hypothetical protein C7B89_19645 [Lysinibacillus capsici]